MGYLLEGLSFTLLAVSLFLVISGGFSYVTSEGEPLKADKAKNRLVYGGFILIPAFILVVFSRVVGLAMAPIETANVTLKEAIVVEHAQGHGGNLYVCELTDTKDRTFMKSNYEKSKAKDICSSYKAGTNYTFKYKHFNADYYIENSKER